MERLESDIASSKYEGLEFLVGIGSYNKTTCNNSYITKFDNVKVFNNYRNCSGSITIPQSSLEILNDDNGKCERKDKVPPNHEMTPG